MRFLLYNIRYGAGAGRAFTLPFPGSGFVRGNKFNIHRISEFIEAVDPDVVGLIEVDTGSIRSGGINQAETIARSLGHYSTYQCKYGVASLNNSGIARNRLNRAIPELRSVVNPVAPAASK